MLARMPGLECRFNKTTHNPKSTEAPIACHTVYPLAAFPADSGRAFRARGRVLVLGLALPRGLELHPEFCLELGWLPLAERLLCSRPLDPKSTQSPFRINIY